jgi:hypothetical protein
VNENY